MLASLAFMKLNRPLSKSAKRKRRRSNNSRQQTYYDLLDHLRPYEENGMLRAYLKGCGIKTPPGELTLKAAADLYRQKQIQEHYERKFPQDIAIKMSIKEKALSDDKEQVKRNYRINRMLDELINPYGRV